MLSIKTYKQYLKIWTKHGNLEVIIYNPEEIRGSFGEARENLLEIRRNVEIC